MKLKKLINRLEAIRDRYIAKHGTEPEIFTVGEEGFLICSKVEAPATGLRTAKKPYFTTKTGLEKFL